MLSLKILGKDPSSPLPGFSWLAPKIGIPLYKSSIISFTLYFYCYMPFCTFISVPMSESTSFHKNTDHVRVCSTHAGMISFCH